MAQSDIDIAQFLDITESHASKGHIMRHKFNPQTSLFGAPYNSEIAKELEQISLVLDANPQLIDIAYTDLIRTSRPDTGRTGMNAEQTLRCAVLMQYRELAYDELSFHVNDSSAFRHFSRLEHGQYPCKTVLQENIKKLSEQTWEAIHRVVIGYAEREGIETGKKIRIDSTAVETDIHYPTDSTLLADGIRIMTRRLLEGKLLFPQPDYSCSDHSRVVKKRLMTILNTKKEEARKAAYRDLLHYAGKVIGYSLEAIPMLKNFKGPDPMDSFRAKALAQRLERALGILRRVIDQTERRVFKGETVSASQKVVSFFEDHTDIIVKSSRETQYDHKVFLSGGASNLILD
jgi:IS5 family transposase